MKAIAIVVRLRREARSLFCRHRRVV